MNEAQSNIVAMLVKRVAWLAGEAQRQRDAGNADTADMFMRAHAAAEILVLEISALFFTKNPRWPATEALALLLNAGME